MSAVQSPAKLFKYWTMINLRFGAGKDARKKLRDKTLPAKDKDALKYNDQTTRGMTLLRNVARGGLAGSPSKIKSFEKTRTLTVRCLKKYCKVLGGDKLEKSHEDGLKFRKLLKQFFLVVDGLDPTTMTEEITSDEGELQLDAFDDLDTAVVDQAMTDPRFADFPDEEFDEEEVAEEKEGKEESEETASTKVPPAPPIAGLQFKQRLQSLSPRYQKALQDGASNNGELEQLMNLATAAGKAQDFEQGLAQLDKLAAELDRVTFDQSADDSGDASKQYQARLKALMPAVLKAQQDKMQGAAEIKARVSESQVFFRKKDLDQANVLLDQVEDLLKAPSQGAADTGAGRKESPKITFTKARLKWQVAKKDVQGQIAKLRAAIVADDDKDGATAAKKLDRVLERFNEGLADTLDALINATADGDRQTLTEEALKIVGNYVAYINSDALVAHIEDNPYVTVTVKSTLTAPLTEIRTHLQAAK